MGFEKEKRKNDERRHFPWRTLLILVIGFALGVIVTLIFTPSGGSTVMYMSGDDFARSEISVVQPAPNMAASAKQDPFPITATYIIERATQMAGGVFVQPNAQAAPQTDALYATATAIIQQATQTAGS